MVLLLRERLYVSNFQKNGVLFRTGVLVRDANRGGLFGEMECLLLRCRFVMGTGEAPKVHHRTPRDGTVLSFR